MINQSDLSVEANEFVPTAPISDIDIEPVQSSSIIEPEPYIQTETHEPFIQQEQLLISTNEADPFTLKMNQLSLTEPIPTTEFEALIAQQPVEPVPQPEQVVESSVSEPIVAAAAIAATTAAVAAAAVGVAKAAAASLKTKTTTDTKKTDVKGKVPPIKRPTAATTTTTTSRLAAKPSTTTATKTTVAPRVASRTLAPKVGEKKTTTTTTITRKPLSNGSK